MKRLFITVLVLGITLGVKAQHEVGLSLGTSHLLGDFGGGPGQGTIFLKDLDLRSTAPSVGLFYRYNFAKRLALRAQFLYSGLNSNDAYSESLDRASRGLQSKGTLMDLSAQFEFHFIPLNLCSGTTRFTPYVAGGIGVSQFSTAVSANNLEGIPASEQQYIQGDGSGIALNLPISVGLKLKTKKNVVLGLETSYRMAFTDELDSYVRQNNDHFFFVNANVSYVFCKGGGRGKVSKDMRCPTYN